MDYEIDPNEPVSMAVVNSISAVDGTDPRSLPPLADELDPNALDALFEPAPDGTPRSGGRITFVYASYRVTVDDGEYLTVESVDRLGPGPAERSEPR